MEIIHTFKHNDIYVGQSNYDVDISKLGLLKYRIPVKVNWFQVGLSEDDFISGLITVTVSISKK